jgi:hypothetical protein
VLTEVVSKPLPSSVSAATLNDQERKRLQTIQLLLLRKPPPPQSNNMLRVSKHPILQFVDSFYALVSTFISANLSQVLELLRLLSTDMLHLFQDQASSTSFLTNVQQRFAQIYMKRLQTRKTLFFFFFFFLFSTTVQIRDSITTDDGLNPLFQHNPDQYYKVAADTGFVCLLSFMSESGM